MSKLPKGFIDYGRTVDAHNGIKIGDHIIGLRAPGWSPGKVTRIMAPWTLLDSSLPGGLKRLGHHVIAVHEIRNGTKSEGETRWPIDNVRRIEATDAKARLKAMFMPTSLLLRAFQRAFSPMHESQEDLDAYAAEIDRRFPNPTRTS